MNKILDLSVYEGKTFDVKLPDGTLLNIKKPTQALVIMIMGLEEKNGADVVSAMGELAARILSNNTNGKTFSVDWVNENTDISMLAAIINGYTDFMREIQSNPF